MPKRYNRTQKKQKKSKFVYFRLFICFMIICAAVVLKYTNAPIVVKLSEKVSSELKLSEAVEVISRVTDVDEKITEVFRTSDEKPSGETVTEPVFNEDYYIGDKNEEFELEITEERKRAEDEAKKLSVETLSFQMNEEELLDDTKAEPFKIPPPSYCSYEKVELSFKYKSPLYGIITSRYGYRDHPIIEDASFHTGLDIAAKSGTAISAFADGTVIEAGKNKTYGNYLLIEHKNGIRSFYGHNSRLSVKKGQRVKLGQKVAEVGSTGMSTGPHLHFEVRKGTTRLDPALYVSPETV